LAKTVEVEDDLSFTRIDVFNTAVSPIAGAPDALLGVEIHLHRIDGDWVSWGLVKDDISQLPGELHIHPAKPGISDKHRLVHFLPDKASDLQSGIPMRPPNQIDGPDAEKTWEPPSWWMAIGTITCVGARRKAPPAAVSCDEPATAPVRFSDEVPTNLPQGSVPEQAVRDVEAEMEKPRNEAREEADEAEKKQGRDIAVGTETHQTPQEEPGNLEGACSNGGVIAVAS